MGLKICCLASGSKGNCCFVSDGRSHILVDLGISALRAEKCLAVLGADPDGVTVVITHSHSDHVSGLKTFCKKHPAVKVLCQSECASGIKTASGVAPVVVPRNFNVGYIEITAMPASHDVPCFGYVFEKDGKRAAVMTDVGTLVRAQLELLSVCDIVMLEANHNSAMLRANPHYSGALKERIASDRGHLSNTDCAEACVFLAASGVRNFILAHLSEENNTPAAALREVGSALTDAGFVDARVSAADQNNMTGLFEVC